MKKQLLYFASILLFSASAVNAQTKVWDMGTNTTLWPVAANLTTTPTVVDGLTEVTGGATFGQVIATNPGLVAASDGYKAINDFKSNGSSANFATNLPTTRYFSFPVTGPTTIKVWFRVNGTGGRRCIVSDGTTQIADATSEDPLQTVILTANYTGQAATTIYVFSSSSINYHKIEYTTTGLGINSNNVESNEVIYANDDNINVSNVTADTKVSVYNILGALIKSVETTRDTSIAVGTGLYIVKAQSVEGSKTVKVLVK